MQMPLTPAFTSLHPYSTVVQPPRQRSISAPGLPRTHEQSRPNLPPNLELDDNRDEVSDVEDAEDPMDVLERCEDLIWEASPFQNPRHHEKIRQVAHNQTLEGLVLLGKKAEPASSDYKAMYLRVFKAVVAKWAALNKSDS